MGKVRCYDFDAVIGIGGKGHEAKSHKIDCKINRIGVGACKMGWRGRGPLVKFKHFQIFNDEGDDLALESPALAKRFYMSSAPRYVLGDFSEAEKAEIERLLATVKNKPRSKGGSTTGRDRKRPPKCLPKHR